MVVVLPQATVVSLGVDPVMLDLDIRLYSMLLYFNLLETWLGPCSRKISVDRHTPVLVPELALNIYLVVLSSAN